MSCGKVQKAPALRDPIAWVREHGGVVDEGWTDERNAERTVKHRKESVLGVGYSGGLGISAKDIEEIRKADPSIDQALNEAYTDLGVPSDYGKSNENEDFAESFAIFITDPSKLNEKALFRMKRTLWLSGFGGKPVMRLAHRVAARYISGRRESRTPYLSVRSD